MGIKRASKVNQKGYVYREFLLEHAHTTLYTTWKINRNSRKAGTPPLGSEAETSRRIYTSKRHFAPHIRLDPHMTTQSPNQAPRENLQPKQHHVERRTRTTKVEG